jgi:hypothetical protein
MLRVRAGLFESPRQPTPRIAWTTVRMERAGKERVKRFAHATARRNTPIHEVRIIDTRQGTSGRPRPSGCPLLQAETGGPSRSRPERSPPRPSMRTPAIGPARNRRCSCASSARGRRTAPPPAGPGRLPGLVCVAIPGPAGAKLRLHPVHRHRHSIHLSLPGVTQSRMAGREAPGMTTSGCPDQGRA